MKETMKSGYEGKFVKVAFSNYVRKEGERNIWVERMWVEVTGRQDDILWGVLDNDPVFLTHLKCGDSVQFHIREIVDIAYKKPSGSDYVGDLQRAKTT